MTPVFQVSVFEAMDGEDTDTIADSHDGDENDAAAHSEDDDNDVECVQVNEKFYYLEYVLRALGIIHAFVSLCMLVAYFNLKVPLAIFKREKEVARKLEFEGLYLSEQPGDEDIKAYWDKLVISARSAATKLCRHLIRVTKLFDALLSRSFPALYWDKFVKKRVRQKYSEQFEFDAISSILGMEKSAVQAEQDGKSGLAQW